MKQHSNHFLDLVTEAKKHIKEISAETLKMMLDAKQEELDAGYIPGAMHISKGVIERDIENKISDLNAEIVLYCSGGYRSALAAYNLKNMGYQHVSSLNAGLRHWVESEYPLTSANK